MATKLGFVAALIVLLGGCSLTTIAADGVADLTERAAPGVQGHWDYEMGRDAIRAGILRLEGVHRISADNPLIQLQLIRAYAAYAYGYLEDEMEQAELDGDYDRGDLLRRRATNMYRRAVRMAKRLLRSHDERFDEVLSDEAAFNEWVADTFDDEEDAETLLWTGYAWGLMIRASGDPSALIDLPVARALVERSVALDPNFMQSSGLAFLGAIEASIPEALGGTPERGRELFEQALERTERRALSVQLTYATTYAVNTNNRELYVSLLREVVEAGDVLPEARLSNKVARRRAIRALAQADELF